MKKHYLFYNSAVIEAENMTEAENKFANTRGAGESLDFDAECVEFYDEDEAYNALTIKEKYNGWSNYATWRVQLELVSDYVANADTDLKQQIMDDSTGDVAELLRDYVEEVVTDFAPATDGHTDNVAQSYAMAFLNEVNWHELAEHAKEDVRV